MPSTARSILRDLSLDVPWELVESFAVQPREKPADANRGAEMIAGRLEAFGVPVTVFEPELYLSLPIRGEVRAGGARFAAKPPAFSRSAPDGVRGQLVYLPAAGGGTPLDRNPLAPDGLGEVRGRIAIIEGFALPNFIAGLEAAGAAGVIAVNPGARLIELAGEGAEATIVTELETGWFPSKLPVATIEGAAEPDQFVLLHGHYDSWDVGVGDNGTGNACMLEVARLLWQHRRDLRRSVRLAWWPGHSTGRYGGSAWFADTFALDLAETCVVHMNCDSPGCRWATSYGSISLMSETEAAVQTIVREATGQTTRGKRPQRNSDYSFNNIGISGCFMASSMMTDEARAAHGYYVVGGCGGNIAWHTEDDTLEIADREVLAKDIGLYLTAVLQFANAEILPIDWRATAAEFIATIDRYQAAAGERFDLSPARDAAVALRAALARFHGGIERGAIAAATANATIRDLARILVPINYTRGPRFRHDPALNIPPLPTIEPAIRLDQCDDQTIGFAQTQVLRGRNRLVAALRDATRLVERALAA